MSDGTGIAVIDGLRETCTRRVQRQNAGICALAILGLSAIGWGAILYLWVGL